MDRILEGEEEGGKGEGSGELRQGIRKEWERDKERRGRRRWGGRDRREEERREERAGLVSRSQPQSHPQIRPQAGQHPSPWQVRDILPVRSTVKSSGTARMVTLRRLLEMQILQVKCKNRREFESTATFKRETG